MSLQKLFRPDNHDEVSSAIDGLMIPDHALTSVEAGKQLHRLLVDAAAAGDRDAFVTIVNFPKKPHPHYELPFPGAKLLEWSLKSGELEVAKALFDAGATTDRWTNLRSTFLQAGLESGNLRVIDLLQSIDKKLRLKDESDVEVAYRALGKRGDAEFLNGLVKRGLRVDFVDDRGRHLLHWVAEGGDFKMVEAVLRDHGADVQARDGLRFSAIDYAMKGAKFPDPGVAILRMLMAAGAEINGIPGGKPPLVQALQWRFVEAAKGLIAAGADVNAIEPGGPCSLQLAAELGDLTLIDMLLAAGALPDGPPAAKQKLKLDAKSLFARAASAVFGGPPDRPLVTAVMKSHGEIALKLIEAGADPRAVGSNGKSALEAATAMKQTKVAEAIRAAIAGGKPGRRGGAADAGIAPTPSDLGTAAEAGDLAGVEAALKAGVPVDALSAVFQPAGKRQEEDGGMTALMHAARGGKLDVMRHLIGAGADVNAGSKTTMRAQRTALMFAAAAGRADAMKLLLDHGADAMAEEFSMGMNGVNVLRVAAEAGHADAVAVLLDHGIAVDHKCNSATALIWAASRGRAEVVRLLIERGARVDAKSRDGDTPLIAACAILSLETVNVLLAAGANPNAKKKGGATPLMRALLRVRATPGADGTGVVAALLSAGAELNGAGEGEDIPLMYAAPDDAGIVRLLIDGGADVHRRDETGCTALFSAAVMKNAESVEALLAAGVDPRITDNEGETALSQSSDACCRELIAAAIEAWKDKPAPASPPALPEREEPTPGPEMRWLEVPDWSKRAKSAAFMNAVAEAEKSLGASKGTHKSFEKLPGAYWMFSPTAFKKKASAIEAARVRARASGFTLLHIGMIYPEPAVALFPTNDPYETIAAMPTGSGNRGVGSGDMVDKLRGIGDLHAFELVGVGRLFVEIQFVGAVKSPGGLAKKIVEEFPDLAIEGDVKAGAARVAGELRRGEPVVIVLED